MHALDSLSSTNTVAYASLVTGSMYVVSIGQFMFRRPPNFTLYLSTAGLRYCCLIVS